MMCNPGPIESVLLQKDMSNAPVVGRQHWSRILGMQAGAIVVSGGYFEVLKGGEPKSDGILLVIRALASSNSRRYCILLSVSYVTWPSGVAVSMSLLLPATLPDACAALGITSCSNE